MNLHCVLTSNLLPLPEELVIAQDFGVIEVVFRNAVNYTFVGQHVVIQGTSDDVRAWLRERATDYIWIGNGVPMMEQFSLLHWCSDAEDPTHHGLSNYDNDDAFIRGRSPLEIGCTETPGMSVIESLHERIGSWLLTELAEAEAKHEALLTRIANHRPKSKRSPTISLKKMRRRVRR